MGRTNSVYWKGSYTTEEGFEVEFTANGTYYCYPGCMYRRNGDPGDPPEEETEVTEVDITSVTDDEGNDMTDRLASEKLKEIEESIEESILDGDYDMGYDCPEPPEEDD